MKIEKRVKFYAFSHKYGRRMLFSFKVNGEADARDALKRFGVKAGWYCHGRSSIKIEL